VLFFNTDGLGGRMKQNITLRLDRELIKKGMVIASRKGTSLNQLLSDFLKQIIAQEEYYELSKRNAFSLLDKGFHLGGKINCSSDKLHERV
jgi:hypothetical protein